jgi:hypothetical protein
MPRSHSPRSNLPRLILSRRGFLGRVDGAGLMAVLGTSAWTAMTATLELPFVNGPSVVDGQGS